MTIELATAVSDYVSQHLPARQCSPNTIRSYCTGLASFIEFAAEDKGGPKGQIQPGDIDADFCSRYVEWLAASGLSPSSVNQRIACLRAFMLYASRRDIACLSAWRSIDGVKGRRTEEPLIAWLTVGEMRTLLAMPDAGTGSGLRDLAMLSLLYDSAARVQGLCDLRVEDYDARSRTVTLAGKGRKTRMVPIGTATCRIVSRYLDGRQGLQGSGPLMANARGGKLSASGVRYVIGKHVDAARRRTGNARFDGKVTPHVFRHTKAMHLLEAGVELIYVRDFLGHVSVTTTEVYARASPEAKRAVVEGRAESLGIGPKHFDRAREEGIIEKLKAIGRQNSIRAESALMRQGRGEPHVISSNQANHLRFRLQCR